MPYFHPVASTLSHVTGFELFVCWWYFPGHKITAIFKRISSYFPSLDLFKLLYGIEWFIICVYWIKFGFLFLSLKTCE